MPRLRDADYGLAMAAGQDAGNRSAHAAGRYRWNEDDWNEATAIVDQLLGAPPIAEEQG
jgi:hypothetical protein